MDLKFIDESDPVLKNKGTIDDAIMEINRIADEYSIPIEQVLTFWKIKEIERTNNLLVKLIIAIEEKQ